MAFKFIDTNIGKSVVIYGITVGEQFKLDKCLEVRKKKKNSVIHLYKAKIPVTTVEAMFQVVAGHGNLPPGDGAVVINTPNDALTIWNVDPLTGLITVSGSSFGIPTTQPDANTIAEYAVTDLLIEPTPL
jgi:hypothetical protein